MAQPDQSGDWSSRLAPTREELLSLVRDAFAHLPLQFRALCNDMLIEVEDFPEEHILEDMGLESPFDLLGFFQGSGFSPLFSLENGTTKNKPTMSIYRRPLLDYWAENEETLGEIITHVLIQEIGQHFGLSDEYMDKIEAVAV